MGGTGGVGECDCRFYSGGGGGVFLFGVLFDGMWEC